MIFLSIIIPQYKETEEQISHLLNSISRQKGIEFNELEVIIINDSSDVVLSNEFIHSYSYKINYIINSKNVGPGMTRQYGINQAQGEYITFLDADDELYDQFSLYVPISCLRDTNWNVVLTSIVKKDSQNNATIKKDSAVFPFLHGKYIKRRFLKENRIEFSKELRHYEDSYFLSILFSFEDYKYLDYPTYVWKYNLSSITRKKRKYPYVIDTFEEYIRCPLLVYEFLKNKPGEFKNRFLIKAIFGIYMYLTSNYFTSKDLQEKKQKYELELTCILKEHMDLFIQYKDSLSQLYNEQKNIIIQSDSKIQIKEFEAYKFLK